MAIVQRRFATAAAVTERNKLDEEAQRWIAENLLLGASADQIASRLVQRGCPLPLALSEIKRASASPYLQGAEILRNRLAKRDWLLGSYGRLAAIEGGLDTVPRARHLPAQTFFRDYYATNRPVLIDGLVDAWPAFEHWSLDYFERALGDVVIEIQAGRDNDRDYEIKSVSHKRQMELRDVVQMLRDVEESNDFYVTANNGGHNRQVLAPLWDGIGPIDGYLDPGLAQDGFFWMGPKGTVTPFHHDLTNNLLIQIRGRKRVALVPSWDTPLMRNHLHCYSGWSSPAQVAALPAQERPTLIDCIIEPGQTLFIPVGWWHHVVGLDMTIGLSFTNFTRVNDFTRGYTSFGQV